MNRIKKILRICEHKFMYNNIKLIGHSSTYNNYNAMSFKIQLICSNCGKIVIEESNIFSITDIASNYYTLTKKHYWCTLDDCIEALETTENANLVKKSFTIKLNKKYNLNLTFGKCSL